LIQIKGAAHPLTAERLHLLTSVHRATAYRVMQELGRVWKHESGTEVKFTDSGAALFA
jgi:hypothetical protein